MAESIKNIRRRIKSITSIEHITSAMKLVSVAKLRRAKSNLERTQGYFHYVVRAITQILETGENIPERYLEQGDAAASLRGDAAAKQSVATNPSDDETPPRRKSYLVITGNRGLAGSFNNNVIKRVERLSSGPSDILAIGSKGRDHFARHGHNIVACFTESPELITFADTISMGEALLAPYERGEVDEIHMVWTSFKSAMEGVVRTERLLPLGAGDLETFGGAAPREKSAAQYMEYEPSSAEVLAYLIPKFTQIKIYNAVVESAACEHAARRIAMENATDNANDMLRNLNLFYNRARQSEITKEITEIVSGAEALA
jgi:F-type H+-transporting ATPase subunit gamma